MKIEPRMRFDNLLRKTLQYYNNLGHLKTQQEEETMNDNLNTQTTESKPLPLTDAELQELLETKPVDSEVVGYVTDTDEAADEPTPTIH